MCRDPAATNSHAAITRFRLIIIIAAIAINGEAARSGCGVNVPELPENETRVVVKPCCTRYPPL
jgi:hypothetical protein